jgi:hypothetical protein
MSTDEQGRVIGDGPSVDSNRGKPSKCDFNTIATIKVFLNRQRRHRIHCSD